MKVTVNRRNLLNALISGGAFSGKRRGLPILECVKINVKDNKVTISSYDSECAVLKRIDAINSDENFVTCVNGSDFLKVLRTMTDEEIIFSVEEKLFIIKHSKGKMKLPAEQADEFPTIIRSECKASFVIDASILFEWISNSRNFVGTNDIKPQLMGMYIYTEGGTVGMCASDGNRMLLDHFEVEDKDTQASAVISSKAFSAILSILNGEEKATITISENDVTIGVPNGKVSSLLPSLAYPQMRRVLPKNNPISVIVDKKELQESVSRASLFTSEMSSMVVLSIQESTMRLHAEDIAFNKASVETLSVEHDGEDITIGMKADYLLDCLSVIESDNVRIDMSHPQRPVMFFDEASENKTIMQMPMVIQGQQ